MENNNSRIIYLTSNSSIETDWKCGMARWWAKEEGGIGIIPVEEAAYFKEGRDAHADLHKLAVEAPSDGLESWAINYASELLGDWREKGQLELEVLCRRAGWVAGAALFLEPATRAEFDTVDCEREIVYDADPLWITSIPDRILRRKSDGKLVDRDYKSVKWVSKSWAEYWPTAAQLHTQIAAIEEEYQEIVAFAQIVGLFKGEERSGKLRHPYVWAYVKGDQADPDNWTPEYKYGLTLTPVWEYPLGIVEWVKRCGAEVAAGVFPFSRPVYKDNRLLADLVSARTHREQEVHAIREVAQVDRSIRAQYFEPRFTQCRPVVGSPCPYLAACHNASVNADPLRSGMYIQRDRRELTEIVDAMIARGDEE